MDLTEEKQAPPAETPVVIDKQAEREARKAALREKLRDGRNSTASGAGENSGGDEPGTTGEIRSGFEEAGRAVSNLASIRRRSKASPRRGNDSSGSPDGRAVRRGRTSGRSSENSGGPGGSPEPERGQRGIGRLTTDEADRPRLDPNSPAGEFYREEPAPKPAKKPVKRGKPITQRIAESGAVKAVVGKGKASLTLTDSEVDEYQETLTAALEDDFEAIDRYLWGRQRLYTPEEADESPIWSNMTEKEISTLVRVMLKGGKRSPAMATVVRGVIDSRDYIGLVSILFPRSKESFKVMRDTHRPPQKRTQQARRGE